MPCLYKLVIHKLNHLYLESGIKPHGKFDKQIGVHPYLVGRFQSSLIAFAFGCYNYLEITNGPICPFSDFIFECLNKFLDLVLIQKFGDTEIGIFVRLIPLSE